MHISGRTLSLICWVHFLNAHWIHRWMQKLETSINNPPPRKTFQWLKQRSLSCLHFLPCSLARNTIFIWLIWSCLGQPSATNKEKMSHPSDILYKSSNNITSGGFFFFYPSLCHYPTTAWCSQTHRNLPSFAFFPLQTISQGCPFITRFRTTHSPAWLVLNWSIFLPCMLAPTKSHWV